MQSRECRIYEQKVNVKLINLNVALSGVSLKLHVLNCVSHRPYTRGFLPSVFSQELSIL